MSAQFFLNEIFLVLAKCESTSRDLLLRNFASFVVCRMINELESKVIEHM